MKPRELALRLGFGTSAVGAFVLGLVGLRTYGPTTDIAWTNTAYFSLQLFLLDSAPLQDAQGSLPVTLEIARFLAPLTTTIALGAAVKKVYESTYRAARARVLVDHTVVCGEGTAALLVARDALAEGRSCVIIAPGDDVWVDATDAALRLSGDPRDPTVLREARIARAREIVVTGDPARTTDVGAALRELLADAPDPPRCYLEMGAPGFAAALAAHEINSGSMVRFEFFDPTDRAARRLLDAHLPAGTSGALVLVGEGELHDAIGREFARRAGSGEVVLAVAGNGLLEGTDLPVELAVVVVAMEGDTRAVQVGLELVSRLRERAVDIVVATTSSTALGSAITGDQVASGVGSARLHLFNTVDHVYALDSLREGIYLDIARAAHEVYLVNTAHSPNSSHVPWEQLTPERQRANIAQAFSIGEKLRSEGLAVIPADPSASSFRFRDNELQRLAQAEHERWCRERRAEGWTPGPRDDRALRHPDLQPWGKLSATSRQKDVDAVRAVPGHLARVGLQIVRTSRPG